MMISRRGTLRLAALATAAALVPKTSFAAAPAPAVVRIGVLKFGTVSWALDTLKHHRFDTANDIDLEVLDFAGEDATNVALLAGAIDMIVSDWLWVSRQRSEGVDLTLVPYSTAVGAIMVKEAAPIRSITDLAGKKIGVAGGPLDKSWLLIQALARRDHGLDLPATSDVVFGAPPLISEKAMQGELDAVLNFWHFCARLEANGFRRLIGADAAAQALGASGAVSALGYVFHDKWANEHPDAIRGFIKASAQSKDLLARSDDEWLRLAPVVRAQGEELAKLRDRYRDGIPRRPVAEDAADAGKLYRVLAEIGGEKLVGRAPEMAPGTFWQVPPQ
ncbi:ABC transporter substrate-binding protein [Mesorhizobium sp.]|uniref:ABC transporter substrate-binding protein n=1 Tax=Mesorhizobium sp. TaxID=1871066 RepID=UPI000FE99CF4|nr:ABC transporter substrate-binding protein [Mesorhizobium sp.]RWI24114.1 MAG: ABC transporter substrate-binding protein [Mesorhizobium sp.]RWK51571.1 MAG: ABC transporter substrate-binding protein [Mesorhizobium sp.]RWK96316.1 MAG: ABC transporter substrate-binding protein [Mesorhizobium sp.]TIQ22114.1 MAG: ABC transporter substrate-binding protein [Mesorhizobium sp.]TIQ32736.1 MAG: ABC transporter substrate-binding protein [Mesorhizobium sp.]